MSIKTISGLIGLVAGSALTLGANPVNAASLFGTNGIKFTNNTTADLSFISSQGQYQSTFGVFEIASQTFTPLFREIKAFDSPQTNDFRSTCGGVNSAIENCTASFNFLAGLDYSFALQTEGQTTVYSTTALNNAPFATQAQFVAGDGIQVNFEDQPVLSDNPLVQRLIDYNDFKVNVKTDTPTEPGAKVPEPAAIAGLAVVGALMLRNRRRISQSA